MHIRPELFAAFKPVLPGVGSAILVDLRLGREDVNHRQVETLPDEVVIGVMSGGDFEGARAKFAVHVFIGNDGHFAVEDGHQHRAPHIFSVAVILRVDCHGGITQDGLRAGGGNRDILRGVIRQHILEVVQETRLGGIFHLQVRDSGSQPRRPVDHPPAAVDESLFVEAHKGFPHCPAESLVEGEALPLPVARGTQAADLRGDDAAVLVFPLPYPLDEGFPSQGSPAGAFPGKRFFHLELGGNPGMVGARQPHGGIAFHAVIADHQVFHGDKQGMPQVQFAGYVGRWNGNDKRLFAGVKTGLAGVVERGKISPLFPPAVNALLGSLEIVCFR